MADDVQAEASATDGNGKVLELEAKIEQLMARLETVEDASGSVSEFIDKNGAGSVVGVVEEAIKTVKNEYESLAKSLKTNANDAVSECDKCTEMCTEYVKDVEKKIDEINAEALKAVKGNADIEEMRGAIQDFVTKLRDGTKEEASIIEYVEQCTDEIEVKRQKVHELFDDLFEKTVMERVVLDPDSVPTDANVKVYTDKTGIKFVMQEKTVYGLSRKLEEAIAEYKNFTSEAVREHNQILQKWAGSYDGLEGTIKSLLPGATSAGLAYAYEEAKNQHKKSAGNWAISFGVATIVMFVIPVIVFYVQSYDNWSSQQPYLDLLVKRLFQILPFEAPVLWYAYFSTCRVKEHLRLHEEYLHKWAVATSYSGLKKQAEELSDDDDNLVLKLLNNTVDVNSTNPSAIIDVKVKDQPILALIDHLNCADKDSVLGSVRKSIVGYVNRVLGAPAISNVVERADIETVAQTTKTKP